MNVSAAADIASAGHLADFCARQLCDVAELKAVLETADVVEYLN